MDCIEVTGRRRLRGELAVQGSKNAVLPIMAAAILNKGTTVIENCPRICDVESMRKVLESIGCLTELDGNRLTINAEYLSGNVIADEYVRRLRASVLLMGAMLGRMGNVSMCLPGGCSIGERPIDFHVKAFRDLSANVAEEGDVVYLCTRGLRGCDVYLPFPSVGATENILLAAVAAEGCTVVHNAAREPEITQLCEFLNCIGADVMGAGGECIVVKGVRQFHDATFRMGSDRIVAGTYCCAVAGTGGDVLLRADLGEGMVGILPILRRMGCLVEMEPSCIRIRSNGVPKGLSRLRTMPFPGFPTDMQSQVMAVLCLARGQVSVVMESIFDARFQVVEPLTRMGARIGVEGRRARIVGVDRLEGARVQAKELRGGAALTLAGLFAEGKTTVEGLPYIQRGYEDIVRDFKGLGAEIRYICKEDGEVV